MSHVSLICRISRVSIRVCAFVSVQCHADEISEHTTRLLSQLNLSETLTKQQWDGYTRLTCFLELRIQQSFEGSLMAATFERLREEVLLIVGCSGRGRVNYNTRHCNDFPAPAKYTVYLTNCWLFCRFSRWTSATKCQTSLIFTTEKKKVWYFYMTQVAESKQGQAAL